MAGWDSPLSTLEHEFLQAREEGRDAKQLAALEAELKTLTPDLKTLEAFSEKILAVPVSADFPFNEPSELEEIRRLRVPAGVELKVDWSDESLMDKMWGAWLGRCVGCALGKPVESFGATHHGLLSWQRLKEYLVAISPEEWPIRDYIPAKSPAQDRTGVTWCAPSTREEIAYMESDDDIRYTVLGQVILEKFGPDFTTWDVAMTWIERLPYKQVCTAETQAYRNLIMRYGFHLNGDKNVDWNWVASHFNPFREWIGAQIRVDSYGYAAPGNPALAAEFAWRDARLSHTKNGIYGAMFCAAMIAASFATDDVNAIVEAGLGEIPSTSRLYAEMKQVVAICQKCQCSAEKFEAVFEEIYDLLGHYNFIHTNNNAGLCVAALLLSQGDFAKGVTLAVMGGLDTDCNGATVGSMVGAITGAAKAPAHWTGRLNNTLNSQIIDYHPIAISECARRSLEIAKKIAGRGTGS